MTDGDNAAAARELTITTSTIPLAAKVWGADDAPLALAVHGWMDNAGSFDGLAPFVTKTHRLVAIDIPGHGASPHRPRSTHYHFIDGASAIIEAAAALGAERFTLIGHSMGGALGVLAAGALPDRFDGLVCLDTLGPLTTTVSDAPLQMAQALTARPTASARTARTYESVEQLDERMARANPSLTREARSALLARGKREVADGYVFSHDPRMKTPSMVRLTEAHVLAFIARISCPTLVVWAEDGWKLDDDLIATRQQTLREGTTATIETVKGGHHVHLTHPERVGPLISSFLATLPR